MTFELYNGEVKLNFNPSNHLYTVEGVKIDGVTSATGVLDKSQPLMYWAVGTAIEYLNERLKPGVSLDEVEIRTVLDEASMQHRTFKKKAADIGTLTHDWIEEWISGKNPKSPVNPSIKNATEAFFKWVKDHKITFISTERKVYSKKYRYAGTLDFVAVVDDKRLIVGDTKTSKGIYDDMRYQVAAYKCALEEEIKYLLTLPEDKIKRVEDLALLGAYKRLNGFDDRTIVRVGKQLNEDGALDFEARELDEYEKDIEAFFACLMLYRRTKQLKGMISPMELHTTK